MPESSEGSDGKCCKEVQMMEGECQVLDQSIAAQILQVLKQPQLYLDTPDNYHMQFRLDEVLISFSQDAQCFFVVLLNLTDFFPSVAKRLRCSFNLDVSTCLLI